ncbi:MAG: TRAM domain-containing protein [Nanoarchaeota archaeon]|nr:TRAM domain-containing protein [Nanoarchaeota archaeon]
MYDEYQRTVPPVREGEEVDVKIDAVGEKGDGIAKVRNFVVFVPNTKQGDTVRIKITKVLKRVGFGEVIGQAKSKPKSGAPVRKERAPEPVYVPDPEDSEDFGEDLEQ